MKKLADRLSTLSPSPTVGITALARQMKAKGIDVITLSQGEPDFDTPEAIKLKGISAIRDGKTKYTATEGTPELIASIRKKFQADNSLSYAAEEIVVSSGAKHSIFNALLALVDPGDEVIVPAPYWVTFPELVKLLGGTPVVISTSPSDHYKMTPAQLNAAITPKTKALIINSPCNPTGAVYSRDELAALGDVIVKNDLYVISDEIYEKIVYNGTRHASIASLSPDLFKRTVTVNGVSKAFAMTGWRIGYLGAPKEIARAVTDVQGQCTLHPSSISMAASGAALEGGDAETAKMVATFKERRDYLVDALNAIPGLRCPKPQGAFYVFPDVSSLFGKRFKNSSDVAQYLLSECRVAVVPGSAFGDDRAIRISYAAGLDALQEAVQRIKQGISNL